MAAAAGLSALAIGSNFDTNRVLYTGFALLFAVVLDQVRARRQTEEGGGCDLQVHRHHSCALRGACLKGSPAIARPQAGRM